MSKILHRNRKSKLGIIINNHIINHKKEYLIVIILFLIGLVIGIMFVNNLIETQYSEIDTYIKKIVNNLKAIEKINYTDLLKESIITNLIVILVIWIASSTIIGIPIVYGNLIFRGFVLGYTLSSIISVLGIGNGTFFIMSGLFLHNIIFIPVILATSVSGMKLYKSIVKNRERENVKIEFIRHTVFCTVMATVLLIASLIEVYISTNLSKFIVNYIKI